MDFLRLLGSFAFGALVLAACGGDTFSSSADGGTDDGGRCDYTDRRGPVTKGCTGDTSCAVVMHAESCCQVRALGINHAFVTDFNAAEKASTSGCVCNTGCNAQPVDEQNMPGTNFEAKCENGVCVSRVVN